MKAWLYGMLIATAGQILAAPLNEAEARKPKPCVVDRIEGRIAVIECPAPRNRSTWLDIDVSRLPRSARREGAKVTLNIRKKV